MNHLSISEIVAALSEAASLSPVSKRHLKEVLSEDYDLILLGGASGTGKSNLAAAIRIGKSLTWLLNSKDSGVKGLYASERELTLLSRLSAVLRDDYFTAAMATIRRSSQIVYGNRTLHLGPDFRSQVAAYGSRNSGHGFQEVVMSYGEENRVRNSRGMPEVITSSHGDYEAARKAALIAGKKVHIWEPSLWDTVPSKTMERFPVILRGRSKLPQVLAVGSSVTVSLDEEVIWVPAEFYDSFVRDPYAALENIAGKATGVV